MKLLTFSNKCSMVAYRRAFTLVELMVSVAVFSLVMGGVAALQYLSARGIKEIYAPTDARSARTMALNFLHFELANGKRGSAVVSNSNHTIEFINPNRCTPTTVTSQFLFDPDARTLTFRPDKNFSTGERRVCRGPVDISFRLGSTVLDPAQSTYISPESLVTLYVRTQANLAYSNVDDRDGECVVYMRNP
jgi:prepilin-type N-terminal cleavage/methylation domain-containing protein